MLTRTYAKNFASKILSTTNFAAGRRFFLSSRSCSQTTTEAVSNAAKEVIPEVVPPTPSIQYNTVSELYKQRRSDLQFLGMPRIMWLFVPFCAIGPINVIAHNVDGWRPTSPEWRQAYREAVGPPHHDPLEFDSGDLEKLATAAVVFPLYSFVRSARYLQKKIPQFSGFSFGQLLKNPLSRSFLQRNAVMAPVIGIATYFLNFRLLDAVRIVGMNNGFSGDAMVLAVASCGFISSAIAFSLQPYILLPQLTLQLGRKEYFLMKEAQQMEEEMMQARMQRQMMQTNKYDPSQAWMRGPKIRPPPFPRNEDDE
eukprot:TRINITY_DN4807_c0_g1_i3.p1 TRINITY_DN4807_c0_g1~~TRINITY_DN4807_c0_g1_i3.p1  ORF type:complete len:311 (+),score=58.63 TRINITY_DN4807_c0_g1_i3:136-1068(+)